MDNWADASANPIQDIITHKKQESELRNTRRLASIAMVHLIERKLLAGQIYNEKRQFKKE